MTSLFRKLKVPRFPPCPLMRRGWLLTRYARRKKKGRASGGAGGTPPVMRIGGAVASRPRNRPLPKAPAAPAAFPLTARVSGCTGQDGQRQRPGVFRASGDVFRGKLGHQEGFWHGVCFPYLDNLGLTFGCKNARKSTADAALRGY